MSESLTECLHGPKHRFQNFWKMHKVIVGRKAPTVNYLKRAQNLSHRMCARPKTPIPEFLENAQNHCRTESPDRELLETCTESLGHPNHFIQNIWKSLRTSVNANTPGSTFWNVHKRFVRRKAPYPECLEVSQNVCTTQNTEGNATGFLFESKHHFQISDIAGGGVGCCKYLNAT